MSGEIVIFSSRQDRRKSHNDRVRELFQGIKPVPSTTETDADPRNPNQKPPASE